MKSSQATFRFVCIGGMVLSTANAFENFAHYFPEERDYLLKTIQKERIQGVIFLTGDRHHTELSAWHPKGGVAVYDLTISPLTSGAYPGDGDENRFLVPGTVVETQNFGVLEVSGPRESRSLLISVYDAEGKKLWENRVDAGK